MTRKQATKQYVRDCVDEDASFSTVKGVRYLTVQKPFEINHEDTLTLMTKKKEGANKAYMLGMSEGFSGVANGGGISERQSLCNVA